MQAEQRAYLEVQRDERIAALERRIFEHAFTLFERAETGALAAPLRVPALPAPAPDTRKQQGNADRLIEQRSAEIPLPAVRDEQEHRSPNGRAKAEGVFERVIPESESADGDATFRPQ